MGYYKRRIIEAMEPKEEPPMQTNTVECDIPTFLRFLARPSMPAESEWMRKAADEIESLRLAAADCASEKAADWKAACESAEAASKEIGRLRLTAEEREAVAYYVGTGGPDAVDATLRSLLERLA